MERIPQGCAPLFCMFGMIANFTFILHCMLVTVSNPSDCVSGGNQKFQGTRGISWCVRRGSKAQRATPLYIMAPMIRWK